MYFMKLKTKFSYKQDSHCHGKFWKKTFMESHGKVLENLLKIKSHEILLRAEKNFFKLLVIPVAVTKQIQSVLFF